MINDLFSLIAPHLCCGCGKTGTLLCDNCKYNITTEHYEACILCSVNNNDNGICIKCSQVLSRGWCVGQRQDALKKLIDDYKFENARAAYQPLAELLHSCVGQLPLTTVVVPIPTISPHIRVRGYDQTALLAKAFAKKRRLAYRPLVYRATNSVQRDASRAQRQAQAKVAFGARGSLDPNIPYLLIDDVVTTGATLTYAAKTLHKAGARQIWAAAIAHQPLD